MQEQEWQSEWKGGDGAVVGMLLKEVRALCGSYPKRNGKEFRGPKMADGGGQDHSPVRDFLCEPGRSARS